MPVRGRRPEDDKPLFSALNDQRLIRPASAGQNGASQAAVQQKESGASTETQQASSSQASETSHGGKGPIAKAVDKAQENNWIYGSVANKARQTGLLDKADGLLSKLTGR